NGGVPEIGLGGELAGWVARRPLGVELAGAGWWSGRARLDPSTGVDVGLRTMALRVGWWPADYPVRAWVAGELGQLRGSGVGLAEMRGGSGTWRALGGGFALATPLAGRTRLVAAIAVDAVLDRIRVVEGSGSVSYT